MYETRAKDTNQLIVQSEQIHDYSIFCKTMGIDSQMTLLVDWNPHVFNLTDKDPKCCYDKSRVPVQMRNGR